MFRRPSLGLAEIAWRWSFGFAAALLLALSFMEYLHTLPVTAGDLFLLRTQQPFLISQAMAHIFAGSGPRVVKATILLGLAMTVVWIAIAALCRSVTLRAVESYLCEEGIAGQGWRMGSLAGLNFLRVAAALAAGLGGLAAFLIAGAASPEGASAPGIAVLIFLTVLLLVWLAWAVMNWVLSFASVFVIAQGEDTFGAIAAALLLPRSRVGPVLAASTWFGLAHVTVFVIASSVVAFVLALAWALPPIVIFLGVLIVTLFYFAVADFLYMGRLAAYVAIVEGPEAIPVVEAAPPPVGSPSPITMQADERVDPAELILSDVPAPGPS